MRKFRITAVNKKHFESIIKDFRNNGFMLVTYGARLAELETKTEFVIIEYWAETPYGVLARKKGFTGVRFPDLLYLISSKQTNKRDWGNNSIKCK